MTTDSVRQRDKLLGSSAQCADERIVSKKAALSDIEFGKQRSRLKQGYVCRRNVPIHDSIHSEHEMQFVSKEAFRRLVGRTELNH